MKKLLLVVLFIIAFSTVSQAATFKDVEGLDCLSAVESLHHIGIINGVNSSQYAPHKKVTRAELSKMIVSALNLQNTNKKSFSDIKGHWGESYIEQAASYEILNGYTDGTFRPDKEVSYAEAIAILIRSLGYNNLDRTSGNWYDAYINKMEEISINEGIEKINPIAIADRQDIAILLWNTIKSTSNGKSLLKKNFSKYPYLNGEKIIEITSLNNRVIYRTDNNYYYIDENIDFSNLGGYLFGFYDNSNHTIIGPEVDSGKNYKRLSGNMQDLKEMGYDIFNCNNIMGYGDKEKAKYGEIFIDRASNKTQRVVFYDTTESHFAESIKIGTNSISIESKEVIDTSIILLKDKKTITVKNSHNESEKDISVNALLIDKGRIVKWTDLPHNSVVREIKKDLIYTYYHNYIDASINPNHITTRKVTIDNKKYRFSEDCICENIQTNITLKLSDAFSNSILEEIVKNDKMNRFYLNEFGEIVKFEYKYDFIAKQKEEKKNDYKDEIKTVLKKVGIVSNVIIDLEDSNYSYLNQVKYLPNGQYFNYYSSNNELKIGDFVYKESGDSKAIIITNNAKINHVKFIVDYSGFIEDEKLGDYSIDKKTQFIGVTFELEKGKPWEYSKCSMNYIDKEELTENSKYKKMHLLVDENDVVIRVYAIKEKGINYYFGVVKEITNQMSGDVIIQKRIVVADETGRTNKYLLNNYEQINAGDFISYDIKPNKNKKTLDTLLVKETFRHELIGNNKDLIVDRNHTKNDYILKDYIIVNAQVFKDKDSGEWKFTSFKYKDYNSVSLSIGSRVAIDELTNVIVVYSGYRD